MERRGADELWDALGSLVVGEHSVEDVTRRAASVATSLLEPVVAASITFTTGRERSWTVASTSGVAEILDEAQYAAGRGPCVDAAVAGTSVLVSDLRADDRWPEYAEQAVGAGILASLSTPLPVQHDVTAALNCYSADPDAFTDEHVELARRVAAHIGVALVNAVRFGAAATLADQLQEAMASRAVIEQAKGVIMGSQCCTPDEAFEVLVSQSQREQRKLRDVAADLVARQFRRPPAAP